MVCILQNLLCSAKNSKKTKTIWFLFLLNQIQSIWSSGLDFAEFIMFSKKQQKTKTIWFLFLLNQIQSDQMVWILQNLLCSAKNSKRPKLCIWFLLNLWKNSNQVKTFFPHLLQNLFCSAKHLLQNLFYLCRLPSAVILQTLWNVSSAWSILSFHRFCRMRL